MVKVKTRYNGKAHWQLGNMDFSSFKTKISPSYQKLIDKYAESQKRIAKRGFKT